MLPWGSLAAGRIARPDGGGARTPAHKGRDAEMLDPCRALMTTTAPPARMPACPRPRGKPNMRFLADRDLHAAVHDRSGPPRKRNKRMPRGPEPQGALCKNVSGGPVPPGNTFSGLPWQSQAARGVLLLQPFAGPDRLWNMAWRSRAARKRIFCFPRGLGHPESRAHGVPTSILPRRWCFHGNPRPPEAVFLELVGGPDR